MWNGRHKIHDGNDMVMKIMMEFPADFCNKEKTRDY
jgi:hypothetical protein